MIDAINKLKMPINISSLQYRHLLSVQKLNNKSMEQFEILVALWLPSHPKVFAVHFGNFE